MASIASWYVLPPSLIFIHSARPPDTRRCADDAPTSSNGSASADSGTSYGIATEGPASSSLNVESLLPSESATRSSDSR
eukprot:5304338-Pleurochrysis_carterae.AAC.1